MNNVLRVIIGAGVGAGIGFLMYRFVGCKTGACPLTGNPYIAMFIWGLMGALISAGR